jgi:hypothetical protein
VAGKLLTATVPLIGCGDCGAGKLLTTTLNGARRREKIAFNSAMTVQLPVEFVAGASVVLPMV